jgi:hypothetical protein
MAATKDERRVRFLLPPSCSRPARDNEVRFVKTFSRHISHCDTCHIDEYRAISVLCDQGCHLAKDLQRLFTWRDGEIQSSCHADTRCWSERVEFPVHDSIVKSFLKTAVRQARQRECSPPVAHDYAPVKHHSALRWRTHLTYYHSTVKICQFVAVRGTGRKSHQAERSMGRIM